MLVLEDGSIATTEFLICERSSPRAHGAWRKMLRLLSLLEVPGLRGKDFYALQACHDDLFLEHQFPKRGDDMEI